MRSPISTRPIVRAIAILIAAVLTFGNAADAFGLDPCPHHGMAAVVAAPAHPAPHAGMSHHATAQLHNDSAAADHSGHDAQHGICTCMGACATSSAIPVPSAAELSVVITPVTNTHTCTPPIDAPRSLYLDLLPYGIAPPTPDILQ